MSSWRKVTLENVAVIERSTIQPEAISQGTAYVGLEHIESGGAILGAKKVEEGELASSKFKFTECHLLYGKLRPYLAKIACPDFSGICSTDILPILPGPELERRFLCYFLRQPSMVEHANSRAVGANLPRLSPSALAEFEIPLPPLAEQRRIAEVLDRAEALRAKRRATLSQFDSLTRSLFLHIFGDPATNPKGWPRKPICEIGKVITGNTPPRANPGHYGTHIEWIKSDNINTPHYYLTKASEGLSESGKAVARTVPAGSILVTCIAGSPECIGNAAMTDREVAFNQQINALVPVSGDTRFLYAQILVGKRLIQEASTSGMKGMVSKGRFEQIMLILPPIELQREFARRVTAAEKLKAAQRASLAELDALFASLQHRAFRGEL
ncbi:MAG: restriction endonuclease subunit S [Verrucomicrobiota bacterium]